MSDAKAFHVGWLLNPADRAMLLARFPPHYPRVVAHHVTLKFGDRQAGVPGQVSGEIVGEADDGKGVQAMIVAIDGSTARPDGGTFHITWSLASGREAKESNDVIAARGWIPLPIAVPVRLIPKP